MILASKDYHYLKSLNGELRLTLGCFFPLLVDNLWSAYSEKESIVEKKDQPSVAGSEETKMSGLPYVFTDIMTYFTMLVGIYFPSVTGRCFSCVDVYLQLTFFLGSM